MDFSFQVPQNFREERVFLTSQIMAQDPSTKKSVFLGVNGVIKEVLDSSLVFDCEDEGGIFPRGVSVIPMREIKWVTKPSALVRPGPNLKIA